MTQARLNNLPLLFNELKIHSLSVEEQAKIATIDACLPQTQCGLCDHPEGCLPYAHAIVMNNEAPNKCIPGGQAVTDKITHFLDLPQMNCTPSKWSVDDKTNRPTEIKAIINEDDCIGCTKCIPACPVDAIIGTGKHMHTIIPDLCTGCELCLPPCPVDCIELIEVPRELTEDEREYEQDALRNRYHHHLYRVTEQLKDKTNAKPVVSVIESKLSNNMFDNKTSSNIEIDEKMAKNTILAAKLRTKIKKLEKQLTVRENEKKRAELVKLQSQLQQLSI